MDLSKLDSFSSLLLYEFMVNYPYRKVFAAGKTSEIREFRVKCRALQDLLVVVLLRNVTVTSKLSQGLYSFSPEFMLEGDDSTVFGMFASLCELLKSCGAVKVDESEAAVEEYHSYIVEKRRQQEGRSHATIDIPDIIRYLVRDFSFQARVHIFRVFKFCCLIIGVPESVPPSVVINLSGCGFSVDAFWECLLLVQSYNLLDTSGVFYVSPHLDSWQGLRTAALDEFICQYRSSYRKFLLERRKLCESHYIGLKSNRETRSGQGSVGSETSSASS